jgi:hypothetical protein
MFFKKLTNRFAPAAAFVLCLMLGFAFGSTALAEMKSSSAATSQGERSAGTSTDRYYIDFRVAGIGAYGHSYVAYGRLNARGKPADARYADLHPRGNYLVMAMGHVLPVAANTEWDPDVLKLPVASSYLRPLNAAQYAKLQVALKASKAEGQPYWNAITNNCNHYVGKLARAVGLRVPPDFQVSYTFVPALRKLNEEVRSSASSGGAQLSEAR